MTRTSFCLSVREEPRGHEDLYIAFPRKRMQGSGGKEEKTLPLKKFPGKVLPGLVIGFGHSASGIEYT